MGGSQSSQSRCLRLSVIYFNKDLLEVDIVKVERYVINMCINNLNNGIIDLEFGHNLTEKEMRLAKGIIMVNGYDYYELDDPKRLL